ncbi:MAG: sigma-70 family RNA polymerase sigma factor [Thermoanaerobaculia bacterium]|nr:sigma-70 family RNA polymerase sigma factor [Thermoanaerobaculia bacterium]
MSPSQDAGVPSRGRRGRFATTHWSLVLAAGDRGSASSEQALAELCGAYWYPLYAYVRRRGYDPDDARDLTQSFFAHLLEKNGIGQADPARGRFRTFLLASIKNFVAGEWRKRSAQKRGGDAEILSIDFDSAEDQYKVEPSRELTPEQVYERRWAMELLARAVDEVRRHYEGSGKGQLFEKLKGTLGGGEVVLPYSELAPQLGMTEGALRTAVFRLRQRWRDELRRLVAATVGDEAAVDDEIRSLLESI